MAHNKLLLVIILLFSLGSCKQQPAPPEQKYIFFLHSMFVELQGTEGRHPEYGKAEYHEIVNAFKTKGFTVISEIRPRGTEVAAYAGKVAGQIDSLLKKGVGPAQITVVGTSKGGYIARFVSDSLKNKDLNFVIIGCCTEGDIPHKFYGNILSIYEKTDTLGQSCAGTKNSSPGVSRYKEIELNTGLKHGFLYKALDAWMQPSMQWANGNYELKNAKTGFAGKIDSLLAAPSGKPFSGVVLISQGGTKYAQCDGFANREEKIPVNFSHQFVIGSVSKQITAVIVLREYDKGNLKLDVPISNYLPELKQEWANLVTVHHLLTHMHGIPEPEQPEYDMAKFGKSLKFKPGSKYEYSQAGFYLMEKVVEKTSGKSFAQLSQELFEHCGMPNTFHPDVKQHKNLATGYTAQADGITPNTGAKSIYNSYVAAGGFISTADDMVTWNNCLHNGKLLAKNTYALMITQHENAVRNHPVFGHTHYGYGITVGDNPLQLGQTGFTQGFISMNFYFPETKTSAIVLCNLVWMNEDLKKIFSSHTQILDALKENKFQP